MLAVKKSGGNFCFLLFYVNSKQTLQKETRSDLKMIGAR
jgi:hypothetical protein